MDTENNEPSSSTKATYIYLDFNGKLSKDILQNPVFLRIENLHKTNPLVQVNDSLFKGSYDHSIGTNMFFEETGNISYSSNIFEKQRPVCYKYSLSSTKVLNLQRVVIPQSKAKIQNEVKNINYNLDWDYKKLLEKFERGTLNIEDAICPEEVAPQNIETEEQKQDNSDNLQNENEMQIEPETEAELDKKLDEVTPDIMPSKELQEEYERLNVLARRPVRRARSPELIADCDKKYKDAYEYHNIECQILQPRDGFKSEVINVDEDTLADCVDIDRCVLFGVIPPSTDYPRVLSNNEKTKLFTLENFDNLSLAGRYYVLQNRVKDLEEYASTISKEKLEELDEYGRTPVQTLDISRKLTKAVKNRLQEIKYFLQMDNEVQIVCENDLCTKID